MHYQIRRFSDKDSIKELTLLLRNAYKALADMGLKFVATFQDEEITKKRISNGECYVIQQNGKLIATVCYYPKEFPGNCEWYKRDDTAFFGQFAVDPALQRQGIGSRMMNFLEEKAKNDGAVELALDTSENAEHLIQYYEKRGYRFIQNIQWEVTNYRSIILSKSLG